MRIVIVLLLTTVLAGCAHSSSRLRKISIGMSKDDVENILGEPRASGAAKGVEYFEYRMVDGGFGGTEGFYWIRFEHGKVVSYGRPGDFEMAAPPTEKLIIQKN